MLHVCVTVCIYKCDLKLAGVMVAAVAYRFLATMRQKFYFVDYIHQTKN